MIWFISDLHLGHEKILKMGKGRPFGSTNEMQETIIKNWNKKVTSDDDVYVLGDVFWGMNGKQISEIMHRLNGRKHLILGNHDRIMPNTKSESWCEICMYKELEVDGTKIVLHHTPIFEWNGFFYKAYHLYGHTHGTLNLAQYTMLRERPNMNCWDVGVDNNNFEPICLNEIKEKVKENIKMLTINK